MKATYFTGTLALIGSLWLLPSCEEAGSSHPESSHAHEEDSFSTTFRGDGFEALISFQRLAGGLEGTVYLSDNQNNPLDAGTLHIALVDENGRELDHEEITSDSPSVFPFLLSPDGNGFLKLAIRFEHQDAAYAFEKELPGHHSGHQDHYIRFSKERQWLLNVAVGESETRPVYQSIQVPVVTRVDNNFYAEITAPVDGRLRGGEQNSLSIYPGQRVSAGDRLAVLAPSLNLENSWIATQLALLQAREDFERAEQLRQDGVISSREFEIRRRDFEARQGIIEDFPADMQGAESGVSYNFELRAPFDGIIGDIRTVSGRSIREGEPLMTLFDPDRLWLDVQAYHDDADLFGEIRGITLIRDKSRENHIAADQIEQVISSSASSAGGLRRTVHIKPAYGSTGLLPGQQLTARIYHSRAENVTAVPQSALFDRDAYQVIFVQHEGDLFEKRIVETGNRYNGWVEITTGLDPGERIVTDGVFPVFLESGSVEISDSHDH